MIKPLVLLICIAVASSASAGAQDARPASSIGRCSAQQIALGTDDQHGGFNRMSHSGTLLVVRNVSPSPCLLSPFATLAFQGREGRALEISVERASPFAGPMVDGHRLPMGHGPVALPIVLQPDASATTTLRWVSGPVFDTSVCVNAMHVLVALDPGSASTAVVARMCGPDASHLSVSATRLTLGTPR